MWDSEALYDTFLDGLSGAIQDELASCELPEGLNALIDLTSRIDKRLRLRGREKGLGRARQHNPISCPTVVNTLVSPFPPELSGTHASGMDAALQEGEATPNLHQRLPVLWSGRSLPFFLSTKSQRSLVERRVLVSTTTNRFSSDLRHVSLIWMRKPISLRVLSKACATSLPTHRPYDSTIELLPGTMLPRGRLYSLSGERPWINI